MGVTFKNYKFKADTYAPELKPKSNPEDMAKIRKLYSDLEQRLKGLDTGLDDCKVEKLVITITKRGGLADEPDED